MRVALPCNCTSEGQYTKGMEGLRGGWNATDLHASTPRNRPIHTVQLADDSGPHRYQAPV